MTLVIDSNSIHNIKAKGDIHAIDLDGLKSQTVNKVTNNQIYSLYTTGEVNGPVFPEGNVWGIFIRFNNIFSVPNSLAELHISGNRVHSFKPVRVNINSIFSLTGIYVFASKCKIWNNDVRLGIDPTGNPVDTTGTAISAITGSGQDNLLIEHNSIYIGGRGFRSYGIDCSISGTTPPYKAFVTNNIIQIDRVNINPPVPHEFMKVSAANTLSAKNIWYSSTDPGVSTLLQNFKQACNCDSSSFVGDPKFINPTGDSVNYNLGLSTGSVADSAGIPSVLSISADINALIRNNYSPVDIGSHAATACAAGVIPQINIISPLVDTVRICSGGSVTITASVTGGSFQQLQWQKNFNNIIGANTTTLTVNAPGVYRLTGKNPCSYVASKIIVVQLVTSNIQPSVSISASSTSICTGASVTFTATPVNQGQAPAYQWQVNGLNVGTNSTSFTTSSLTNNSQVKVILTNTTTCAANPTVTSNIITMTVSNPVVPAILISGNTTVIAGQATSLSATPANGGTNPAYQWQDSTVSHTWQNIAGATASTLNYTPVQTGNKIRCVLTSNAPCPTPATVNSNVLIFTVNPVTAINPVSATSFGIRYYPNPVNSTLYIDSLKVSDKWQTLEIKSIDGKSVIPIINIANRTTIFVNVDRLPGGLYIAVLRRKLGIPAYLKFVRQ